MRKPSWMTLVVIILLVAPAFASLSYAEPPERMFIVPHDAALKGLEDVRRLVPTPAKSPQKLNDDNEYAKALGFDSAQESGNAQVGGFLPIYRARLDSFKNFFPDFSDFLISTSSRIVTLHIDGKVKSSVTIAKDPQTNRWHAVEWGNRRLIKLLEQQRQQHPGIMFYLIISPANPWGLRFVGEERAGQYFLTPISNIDELHLAAGQEVSGASLVTALRALADKQP